MTQWTRTLLVATLGAGLGLSACETAPPPLPPPPPVAPPPPPPPPPPKPRDLSLGPQPRSAPVSEVSRRSLAPPLPAAQDLAAVGAGGAAGVMLRSYTKPSGTGDAASAQTGAMSGLREAHTIHLQTRGRGGLGWSDALATAARLQARQSRDWLCRADDVRVLTAPGEAILAQPAGTDGFGAQRLTHVTPRQIVTALAAGGASPLASSRRGESEMGCAHEICDDLSQFWVCRYK